MGRAELSEPMPEGPESFECIFSQWERDSAELVLNLSLDGFMAWLMVEPSRYMVSKSWCSLEEFRRPDGSQILHVRVPSGHDPPGSLETLCVIDLHPLGADKLLLIAHYLNGPPGTREGYIRFLSDARRLFSPDGDGASGGTPAVGSARGARGRGCRGGPAGAA